MSEPLPTTLPTTAPTAPPEPDGPDAAATRVRLRFAKRGDFRLVSHHDLLRCLERTLRRADLPVAQTQGFNPRPRVAFPSALGLGIEACREVLELELAEPLSPGEVLRRLAAAAPPGFDFREAEALAGRRPGRVEAVRYALTVPDERRADADASLRERLARPSWPYTRQRPDRGRAVEIDLRPFVMDATLDPDGTLRFRLKVTPQGSARPEEVLEAIGLRDLLDGGCILVRTDVELAPDA